MKQESYLGRCARDTEEAQEIIKRLEAQGVPFEKILATIRAKADKAIARAEARK